MSNEALSQDDLALGRAILLATDSLGMGVEGAFWLFEEQDKKWSYFLATSLASNMGPRSIYEKLYNAFVEVLSESEIYSFTFYIADPNEHLVEEIRSQVLTGPHATAPQMKSIKINGENTGCCVYRMSRILDDREAKAVQRRFSRRYNELVAV